MKRRMKDSGIEWIGEIPEDWECSSISKISKIKTGSTPSGEIFSDLDGLYWLKTNNLLEENGVDESELKIKDEYKSLVTKARAGSTLVSCIGDIGKMAFLSEEASYNQQINSVTFNNKINDKFGFYSLFSQKEQHKKLSNGNVLQILNSQNHGLVKITFPKLQKQTKIANFLDKKTGKISEIKSTITKEIENLEDYKKSIITEAVTKGLDKNAKMKDSGIEWIGKIPEHWEVVKGKYIFKLRNENGNNISLIQLSPTQEYGVIPQNIYENLSGMRTVKLSDSVDLNKLKTIHLGDFCISLRSFQGGFEYSQYEGVVSPAYQVFCPFVKCENVYFKYLFKERGFIEKMNSYTMSLRDGKNISFKDFGNTLIPFLPLKEQQQIVSFLDHKTKIIDDTIAAKKKQLEVLEEYKKSLIYEYVTGKREVEDEA